MALLDIVAAMDLCTWNCRIGRTHRMEPAMGVLCILCIWDYRIGQTQSLDCQMHSRIEEYVGQNTQTEQVPMGVPM